MKTDFWRQVLNVYIALLSSGLEGAYSTFAFVSFFDVFLSFYLGYYAGLTTSVIFFYPKLKILHLTGSHFFFMFLSLLASIDIPFCFISINLLASR